MLSYVKTKQCNYSPISPRHAIGITEGSPAYGVRVRWRPSNSDNYQVSVS